MINTNELMLGNYVRYKGKPRKVESIYGYALRINGPLHVTRDNCEPIPITEEILEKCGFIKYRQRGSFIAYTNTLDEFGPSLFFDDEEYHFLGIDKNIKFLHELQNQYFLITEIQLNVNL